MKIKHGTKLTNEQFLEVLKEKAPLIEPLEPYINSETRIRVKCHGCSSEYSKIAGSLWRHGCLGCTLKNKRKQPRQLTHEQFLDKPEMKDSDFILISTYKSSLVKLDIKCSKCGLIKTSLPSNILRNPYCPKCSKSSHLSHHERKIIDILTDLGLHFTIQKTFKDLKSPKGWALKFDFYIPSFNWCIEYDGEQHFDKNSHYYKTEREFEHRQKLDKLKDDYCISHKIHLTRLSYIHAKFLRDFIHTESILIQSKVYEDRKIFLSNYHINFFKIASSY
jgi:hypothetical protein